MNEQFRKLAEAAFFDETTNSEGQKMYMFGERKMQKFAELIVQQCLQICQQGTATQTTSAGAAQLIQQHFALLPTDVQTPRPPLDSSYPDGDGYWK